MELGLFLILLVNIGLISATDWETQTFTKPEGFPCDKIHVYDDKENCPNWNFDPTSNIRTVYIKFEEEQEEPILIANIHCTDCEGKNAPQIGLFDTGSRNILGPEIEKVEDGIYSLTIKNKLDHETEDQRAFKFSLLLEGVDKKYFVKIDLIDIDDVAPQIKVHQTPCIIPENFEGETNCTYFITDPDFTNGLTGITFTMDKEYEKHFKIQLKPKNKYEADAVLMIRENKTLDFETMPMYFFELTGKDAGGMPGTALIMIKVKDMNDQPPKWVEIFAMKSFDEHAVQRFTVQAKDGDLEINDDIIYTWENGECYYNKITIIPNGENAIIQIEDIDRDTPEMEDNDNTIKCTIIASEKSSDLYTENATLSFIIQDINDNKPLITLDESANSPIKLREEEFVTLEKLFAIEDIDQGNNAQFDVILENTAGNIREIDYRKPFQIIPNNGYRNWEFSVSVVEPELLDFDISEDWHKFSLKILSKDKGVKPQQQDDDKIIYIELQNLNDEIPIFDVKTNYTVEIPEDAPKGAYILNVLATDADTGDCIEYKLPLGGNDYNLVPQENKSTTLFTARDNVFDYEKVQTVFIQITATDTLRIPDEPDNFHTVTQQITVSVKDVNDEKPRINLPSNLNIKEHEDVGTIVTDAISAEDPDTTALLKFSINWDKTKVSKMGVQETNTSWFEDVFTIETYFPNENKKGYAKGILKVNDNYTLDYEVFDTIFLSIQVTDEEQVINDGTDEGILTILIIDINDNPPEFVMDTINSEKKVTENSKIGLKIATITAIDIDGVEFNKVEYSLKPRNKTVPGLVEINKDSGELTVAGTIDADGPKYTYYLYYDVIATNGDFHPSEPIEIFIEDENDNEPILNTPLTDKTILERAASDEPEFVQTIDGKDWDRDEPHNVIKYQLDNEITHIENQFSIDNVTGKVSAYGKIDWNNDEEITINIIMEDNIDGSGKHNVPTFKFNVKITDIDNNPPILPKPEDILIEAKEDTPPGTSLKEIIATDKDKPCTDATKIEYTILEVKDSKDQVLSKDLFTLSKKVGSSPECKQIAELKVKSSLKDHYGKIFIKIRANNPVPENKDEETYEINVKAVNYKPPKILSPEDSVLILQKKQTAGKKLIAIDTKYIKDFEATDDQGGKFEMRFERDTPWDDVFEIINKPEGEKNLARLTLKVDKPPKEEYILNIKAQHDGLGALQNFVTKKITVKFVDENQLPGFDDLEAHIKFKENKTEIICQQFPAAKDPKCGTEENDNCQYKTYYHIMNIEERVFFKIDDTKDIPELCLRVWLDTEEQAFHYLTIVATNNDGAPPSIPDGYKPLKLTVEAEDVNDNPPSFVQKLFKGGFSDSDKTYSVIITLNATDPDVSDLGKLRYEILPKSMTVSDSSLNPIKDTAFRIQGVEIQNLVQPTQAMQGYFLFKVMVLDTLDFNDTAEVKIHVISDANRVMFKFNEHIDSVKLKQGEIEEIFSKELGYSCTIDDFARKLNNTDTTTTRADSYITEVKTHFIDNDDEPVDKEIITVKLDDLQTVGRLKYRLKDTGLTLIQVENQSNNESDAINDMNYLLQILLIVVSVVLGTLCIILIVAFVLRTRSLNKRLDAMTTNIFGSTKSDLNRVGISAPGTNRHAIEANPVWNEEIDNVNEYDTMSQASGGSDLIGVEDRPDFASYDYGRPSINPVMQQHLHKRSKRDDDDDDDISSLPGSNNNSTLF